MSQNLQRLVDLAKEPSSERRRELMREVTDIFLEDPGGYSDSENEAFGEVLAQVARDVETAMRAELATRLADVPEAPGNLINELARGEIEVAEPLLRQSKALSEEQLMSIVQGKGATHALAVSQRDDVSEDISEALVNTGDDKVLTALVQNDQARFNRTTLEKVVDRSEALPQIQERLVNRADLPPDLMNDMFFFVGKQLKERILERNSQLDPAMLEEALNASRARVSGSLGQKFSVEQRRAAAEVNAMARKKLLNERAMMEMVNNARADHFLLPLPN